MFKLFRWIGSVLSVLTIIAMVVGCIGLAIYFGLEEVKTGNGSGSGGGANNDSIKQIGDYCGFIGGVLFAAGALGTLADAGVYFIVLFLALFKKKRMTKYASVLAWNAVATVLLALFAIVTIVSIYYSKLPASLPGAEKTGSDVQGVINIFGAKISAWVDLSAFLKYITINNGSETDKSIINWALPLGIFAVLSIVIGIIARHAGILARDNYRTEEEMAALKAKKASTLVP